MGWASFKTGDLALAEKSALAAWKLAEDPTAGDQVPWEDLLGFLRCDAPHVGSNPLVRM